jgi:Fe2+ or Zn2+ uptake regulation protein
MIRPIPDVRARLAEEPHAHIVCRNCGRIAPVELDPGERELLVALGARHPDGWRVDRIAFSLMGSCARCQIGSSA